MISNPKKPRVLLDLYIKSQDGLENQLGPVERENLLKWAYLESSTFLKRYGDVLEEIRAQQSMMFFPETAVKHA